MAIVAITASSAAPSFQRFIEKQRLEAAGAELVSDLHFARGEAVARNTALRLDVQPLASGSCYVLHSGAAGACLCGESGAAQCTGDAQALKAVRLPLSGGVALSANVSSILFDPLHATASPTATFRLATASGRSIEQVVNIMGRVRSCSPQGSVAGYAVC